MENKENKTQEANQQHCALSKGRRLLKTRLGYSLGIVFGPESIYLCLTRNFFGRIKAYDARTIALDQQNDIDWPTLIDKTIDTVKEYTNTYGIEGLPINIGLAGQDIAFRRMYLPDMPKAELEQAILWEGEKLFPFPFSESAVHFEIVDKIKRSDVRLVGVNIVAAKSFIIDELYRKFRAANLNIGQVNFLPVLMAPLLPKPPKYDKDDFRAILLHFDDKRRSMTLFLHNGNLEFFQEFVTPIFPDQSAKTGIANIDAIVAEFQSFQDLYIAQSRTSSIDSIVISGPLAQNNNLIEHFGSYTGVPCQSLGSYMSLTTMAKCPDINRISRNLPVIMTAGANPNKHPLAPKSLIKAIERRYLLLRTGIAAVLSLIIIACMSWINTKAEKNLATELKAKKAEVAILEQSKAYRGYLNLAGKLHRGNSYLKIANSKKDSHFHIILKALSHKLPSELNFTDLYYRKYQDGLRLRLMGHVRVIDFSPEIILAKYIETLRKYPFLRNINVTNYNKESKNNTFDLSFQLQMDTRV